MQRWSDLSGQCIFCAFRSLRNVSIRPYHSTAVLSRPRLTERPVRARRVLAKNGVKSVPCRLDPGFRFELAREARRKLNLRDVVLSALNEVNRALNPNKSQWSQFKRRVIGAIPSSHIKGLKPIRLDGNLRARLEDVFHERGLPALKKFLEYEYLNETVPLQNVESQKILADLRYPFEWYPAARAIQRKIHLHVGPTNSGKTYHALKKLEESGNGFYAGPLRLLAHEVYSRFNAKGIPCGLVTGDDVRLDQEKAPSVFAHTVEMVPINLNVEVAVIDEIQMMGDAHRGWAWTRAFLGSRAKELHLCGEARVVPLIREITAAMGDKLEIHRYERLNPLRAMSTSLKGELKRLRKGDAVICFSRIGIHAMKREIEVATGRRCAVVYGSLPPETRAQQAELFNNPDNDFDFIVASDAIGMGLNLSIKRIVFEEIRKRSGQDGSYKRLTVAELKQIAGRAGRYRIARKETQAEETTSSLKSGQSIAKAENMEGLVTCLHDMDLPYIQSALASEPPPLEAAGIQPPTFVLQRFASYFPPGVPFSYILARLDQLAIIHPRYFLCSPDEAIRIADEIEGVKELDVLDRYLFTAAPIPKTSPEVAKAAKAMAQCIADQRGGSLLEIKQMPLDVLDEPPSGDKAYLSRLEGLHKALILYIWLSFRFGGIFINRAMAFHAKSLVEEKIDQSLLEFSANRAVRQGLLRQREAAMREAMRAELEEAAAREASEKDEAVSEGDISSATTAPVDESVLPVDWTSKHTESIDATSSENTEPTELRS